MPPVTARRRHLSPQARRNMSAARRGKRHPHRGHPLSATTRARISARLKGRPHPHKGHKLSAATRAKISAALKGKHHKGHPLSAATRAKISAKLKGRTRKGHPVSAATRAKISAALRGRRHAAARPTTFHTPSTTTRPTVRRRTHRTAPRTVARSNLPRYVVKTRRIKVGARRSLFRRELLIGNRHRRFLRTDYNPRPRGFLRGGR